MGKGHFSEMDEYHAFMSSCEDDSSSEESTGGSYGCLPGLVTFLAILLIISKFFS